MNDMHPQTALAAKVAPKIRLSGITKRFGGVTALSDVSVDIYPGEVHAILGENGAGKSTLMNIIAGVFRPTEGTVDFDGVTVNQITPEKAAALGVSVSYQHPAVLDDLSVLENLRVALPARVFQGGDPAAIARGMLADVGLAVDLHLRADALTVAQKHLLEIAKALATRPPVLILDEPTAALDQDATEMLFDRIRAVVAQGTAVIYITHRLAELRQIAHRVTVLRDGRHKGGALVRDVTDDDLMAMIVGRSLASAFPPKCADAAPPTNFAVAGLSGGAFHDVGFAVGRGQIIGIAGVEGNGQAQVMRALAGLEPWRGQVTLNGKTMTTAEVAEKSAYMPSDRHAEGIIADLTVRENATFSALDQLSRLGIMNRRAELAEVKRLFGSLAVKTPGLDAGILSLSGGNQQKVVMARALMSQPGFILADEPTQGVDVGARFEIYRILREVSQSGTPVIVNSSDAAELEGLCDIVIVLSRGHVAETLTGADVTEERIVAAAVKAQTHLADDPATPTNTRTKGGLRAFIQSDNATVAPLAVVIAALGLYVFSQNGNYFSAFNISNILLLATALGFIAMGQTIALLMGGIDLSVGPLAGFLVVVASFFINDGQSPQTIAVGFALMVPGALVVGSINGLLIRFANFTPIAATLAMYIGLQGMSFVLRDGPDGYINFAVMDFIGWKLGPIPVAFVVLVVVALVAEYVLRARRTGWQLRAVGSDEGAARRMGIRVDRVAVLGYIAVALCTALGAVMLMVQIGVGDPQQGVSYTLASITAVVLGGTSLRGGRGTFIGTVMGAILLTQVLNAVSFLGLSQTWQYLFQGVLILAAALIYSTARSQTESLTAPRQTRAHPAALVVGAGSACPPHQKGLTMDYFTESRSVEAVNTRIGADADPRLAHVMARLVAHLHAFVKDVALTQDEWAAAIGFLTRTGQICDGNRQEFILLSDVLGVSMLVDAINNRRPTGATENTVLGPFHVDGVPEYPMGASITKDGGVETCVFEGRITDLDGTPLDGVRIDVWSDNEDGFYDVQQPGVQPAHNNRGVFITGPDGRYSFRGIKPVSYPIPDDGPVGQLLAQLGRHPWRPAHMHFIVSRDGFDTVVTHTFVAGDGYLTSDAVFGVKETLVAPFDPVAGGETKWRSTFDFVLNRRVTG